MSLKFDFWRENSKKGEILVLKCYKFPDLPPPTADTKMATAHRVLASAW